MRVRTSQLVGPALDWAVAAAEGYVKRGAARAYKESVLIPSALGLGETYSPSTNWAQGGQIIEKERMSVLPFDDRWEARCAVAVQRTPARFVERRGPTMLVAAMRCFVAAKLGDEVDLPDAIAAAV